MAILTSSAPGRRAFFAPLVGWLFTTDSDSRNPHFCATALESGGLRGWAIDVSSYNTTGYAITMARIRDMLTEKPTPSTQIKSFDYNDLDDGQRSRPAIELEAVCGLTMGKGVFPGIGQVVVCANAKSSEHDQPPSPITLPRGGCSALASF